MSLVLACISGRISCVIAFSEGYAPRYRIIVETSSWPTLPGGCRREGSEGTEESRSEECTTKLVQQLAVAVCIHTLVR